MREHVHADGDAVELRAAAAPYQHVRSIGEDVSAAELLLPVGHRLRPVDVAAAGAAGAIELVVRRQPVVTVIPTGDEIRPVGSDLGEGDLPDTNSVMLAAQARAAGCEAHRFEVVPDVPEQIAAAIRAAAARSDLVVVIAGSSAGRDDHTAEVVAEVGTLAVHGVAVRPGHPVVLGVAEGTPVLGAPGYPVSASLTFEIFAAPLLARLQGAPPPEWPVATARLARKLASTMGMDDWVRVRLGRVGGQLVATPLPRGAGVLTSLVRADGLLVVPADARGAPCRRGGVGAAAARRGRDRAHHRGHRLARPRARPRRLRPAGARPAAHPRVVERRLTRRAHRPARWTLPCGRLASARPGERRVHAAVCRAPASGPRGRRLCGWCIGSRG